MEKKYEQYYAINLKEIEGFFGGSISLSFFEENNIRNLGELFEVSEKIEFINAFTKEDYHKVGKYKEFSGIIKLLRYKYLGEDINFDINSDITDLGFTSRALTGLARFCINNNHPIPVCFKNLPSYVVRGYNHNKSAELNLLNIEFLDFFELLANDDFLHRLFNERGVGKNIIDEIRIKSSIIVDWYKEKYINKEETNLENVTANDLKNLLDELERLMEQNKVLNERIAMVQRKIKQCMEASNETRRQK